VYRRDPETKSRRFRKKGKGKEEPWYKAGERGEKIDKPRRVRQILKREKEEADDIPWEYPLQIRTVERASKERIGAASMGGLLTKEHDS